MSERLKAMKRVLKVQDQLKRSADWRLAEAERAAADVEAAKAEFNDFLARTDLSGPLAGLAVRRTQRLAAAEQAAVRVVESETATMREVTARQKLVAKSVDALAREEASARERKDLERLIEGFAGRTALPDAGG